MIARAAFVAFIVAVEGLVVGPGLGGRIDWEMRRIGCGVRVRSTCRVAEVVRRDSARSDDIREGDAIFGGQDCRVVGVGVVTFTST